MHMQGDPRTMQQSPRYAMWWPRSMRSWWSGRVPRKRGVESRERIVLDPGFGFGKTWSTTWRCCAPAALAGSASGAGGLSRKSMLGRITGRAVGRAHAGSVAAPARGAARRARSCGCTTSPPRAMRWRSGGVKKGGSELTRNPGPEIPVNSAQFPGFNPSIPEDWSRRKYFGTDGVRGRVGEAPITPDFVMRLGYAAGKVLARARGPPAASRPRC
jgi:hypothetical protein